MQPVGTMEFLENNMLNLLYFNSNWQTQSQNLFPQ